MPINVEREQYNIFAWVKPAGLAEIKIRCPIAIIMYNKCMSTIEKKIAVPLTITEYGTIRIADSRVSLDSIIHHYKLGATAEEIAYSFPSLDLADIHLAIAYYLTNRLEVEEYLQRQNAESDLQEETIKSDPIQQKRTADLRERILTRWTTRHTSSD
jgi:uncharacterized protein (DUF433 family)